MQKSDKHSSMVSPHFGRLFSTASLPVVHILHTDFRFADSLRQTLEAKHYTVKNHATFDAFIGSYAPGQASCLLTGLGSPDSDGAEFLLRLRAAGTSLPVIFLTDRPPVSLVRSVLRGGGCDFLPTSPQSDELFETIKESCGRFSEPDDLANLRSGALKKLSSLSPRQRQIMEMIISGHTNKVIAFKLGIGQRTVESHRAEIMSKLGTKKSTTMVRLVILAGWKDSVDGT